MNFLSRLSGKVQFARLAVPHVLPLHNALSPITISSTITSSCFYSTPNKPSPTDSKKIRRLLSPVDWFFKYDPEELAQALHESNPSRAIPQLREAVRAARLRDPWLHFVVSCWVTYLIWVVCREGKGKRPEEEKGEVDSLEEEAG